MKTIARKINLGGFTIIELMIVVSIIGILAAMVVVDLNRTRIAARDSQRRASVQGYANAVDLYFNTWKSYVIEDWSVNNGSGCDYSTHGYGVNAPSMTLYNYSNYPSNPPACVGYFGQGWGSITVSKVTYAQPNENLTAYYSSTSIADALIHDGLLASVQTDPNQPNAIQTAPGPLGTTNYGTFLYTVCDKYGNLPTATGDATNFAVLSELESPFFPEIINAQGMCGNNPKFGAGNLISNFSPHP
jgi:prepilin-type N-terminal cleavage/methylation domain-containing protein